jgi:hypothetical protein
MMEAARTSETLVNFYQTTRRYNREDSHLSIVAHLKFNIAIEHVYKFGFIFVYLTPYRWNGWPKIA